MSKWITITDILPSLKKSILYTEKIFTPVISWWRHFHHPYHCLYRAQFRLSNWRNLPWRSFCRLGRWKIHWCGPVCMCVVAVAVAKEDTTGKRPLCAACNSFYRQWILQGDANQVANCWHLVLKSNMSNSGGKEPIVPLLKSTVSVKHNM